MSVNIEGTWNGVYSYDSKDYLEVEIIKNSETKSIFRKLQLNEVRKELSIEEILPDNVPFELIAKKVWFNRFKGTVQDESKVKPLSDLAKIHGKQYELEISFTKIYPLKIEARQHLKYECLPDGTKGSLEYYHPRVFYHGFMVGENEIKGTWMILPIEYYINGVRLIFRETIGKFYMFRSGTSAETEHPLYEEISPLSKLAMTLEKALTNA